MGPAGPVFPAVTRATASSRDDAVIVVLGPTGSGKSTFVRGATGNETVKVGNSLESAAKVDFGLEVHRTEVRGQAVVLVDTIGIDDTHLSDADVLEEVAIWLVETYVDRMYLAGIIYTHDISRPWILGSVLKNLQVFRKLIGGSVHGKIVLVTTGWHSVGIVVGKWKEKQLIENKSMWGGMIDKGSTVERWSGTAQDARRILDTTLNKQHKVVLNIKKGLVEQRSKSLETAAVKALTESIDTDRITPRRDVESDVALISQDEEPSPLPESKLSNSEGLLQQYQSELSNQKRKLEDNRQVHDEQSIRTEASSEDRIDSQKGKNPPRHDPTPDNQFSGDFPESQSQSSDRYHETRTSGGHPQPRSQSADRHRGTEIQNPKGNLNTETPSLAERLKLTVLAVTCSLLSALLQPPQTLAMVRLVTIELVIMGLAITLVESYWKAWLLLTLLWEYSQMLFRPRLRAGYRRLEWRCTCGELLYGDYREAAPNSLDNLAARLRECVGGQPQQAGPISSSSSLSAPAKAYSRQSSSRVGWNMPSGSGRNSEPNGPAKQGGGQGFIVSTRDVQQRRALQLCIETGKFTLELGELEANWSHSDGLLFERMREQYEHVRHSILPMRWRFRKPEKAIFVKFRLAKRPFVSPMAGTVDEPSMPPEQEVHAGNYEYVPCPIDEPAIDNRTFFHHFYAPAPKHPDMLWTRRLPWRVGPGLDTPMAHGWGIHLEERPDWPLFAGLMFVFLLVSGVVAGIYGWRTGDRQTGVAIGAWLTAVQAMGMTALFFWWA